MTIMGSCCRRNWYPICVNFWVMIFNLSSFSSFSQPVIDNSSPTSLDDYLYNYSSSQILPKAYTGVLYNISLPSNFSGMAVSVLRLRGNKLWDEGANFSSFYVPPRVLPMPYVKRVQIMHENFGNWSTHYYKLPGYSFVTAVVGLAMYDASDLASRASPKRLGIQVLGDPITIHFPEIRVSEGLNVTRDLTCVMFHSTNGNVELSNMTSPSVCSWQALGHFGVAKPITSVTPAPSPVPYHRDPTSPSPYRRRRGSLHRKKRKNGEWRWWVIGFVGGLVGLGLLVVGTVVCYTTCTSRKIREMERRGEKSEALDTIWIGNSRMPLASMTRTQVTSLEDDSNP